MYRCINSEYDKNFNGIQYLSVNKEYSNSFGEICYKITLDIGNYTILNLGYWNKIYTDKTGKNGNIYNRHQGLFIIGEMAIGSNYADELKLFNDALGDSSTQQFLNELYSCDAIYGEDAGYVGEFVYAVKNKKMIVNIEKY